MRFCARCHGANATSDGSVPDLRRLENHWYQQFSEVVLGGSMLGMGMPAFDDVLDEAAVGDIRAYVLDEAQQDWAHHQSSDWWMAIKLWCAGLVADVIVSLQ